MSLKYVQALAILGRPSAMARFIFGPARFDFIAAAIRQHAGDAPLIECQ
jgi:hypothetical protein